MKNYFNIKTLAIFVLTFICFFALNNKVEARSACYYKDFRLINNESNSLKYLYDDGLFNADNPSEELKPENILVQLVYENGNATFKYYDKNTQKTYRALVANHGEYTYSFSSESGKSLTASDFTAGCPEMINQLISPNYLSGDEGMYIFDVFKEGSEYYQAYYGNYHGTYLEQLGNPKQGGTLGNSCYHDDQTRNEWCNIATYDALPETVIDKDATGRVCSYVNYNTYGKDGFEINAELTLKMDSKSQTLSATRTIGDIKYPTVTFAYSDTNGQCPSLLFLNPNQGSSGMLYMQLVITKGETTETYALIKSIKQGRDDIKNLDGCQIFGSAAKYIRIAYKFLRYAIPTLIVIFSVLDFLGVVFSGEDEKMEKAKSKFIKRIIVGILILLIPVILEFILKLAGINGGYQDLPEMVCTWLS